MRRVLNRTLALWVGLVLASCGSDGGSADRTVRDLAQALCELADRCCSPGETRYYLGPFVDQATCVDRLVQSASQSGRVVLSLDAIPGAQIEIPNLEALNRAIADGRVAVDDAGVAACVESLRAMACNAPPGGDPPPVDACALPEPPAESPCAARRLFKGLVDAGGRCTSPGDTLECERGLVCRSFGVLGVEGACVEPGVIGEYCFTDDECQVSLYCRALDGTCQVPGQEGESCQYANPQDPSPDPSTLVARCDLGLSCDPASQICVAPCQRGATCAVDDDCDAGAGLVCVLSRCDVPHDLGQPCADDGDCDPAFRCEVDPGGSGLLLCSKKLDQGEPCPPGGHDECTTGFCNSLTGACALPRPAGQTCPTGSDRQCTDAYCDTTFTACTGNGDCPAPGVCNVGAGRCEFSCVAHLDDGSPCTEGRECRSGACVASVCQTLPMPDGAECTAHAQCASGFCGLETTRVCTSLPLPNGSACTAGTQCMTGVCFQALCRDGLTSGQACDDPANPPCGQDLFCDPEDWTCRPLLGAGEACQAAYQCRGGCANRYGYLLCDPTPAPGQAVCGGDTTP